MFLKVLHLRVALATFVFSLSTSAFSYEVQLSLKMYDEAHDYKLMRYNGSTNVTTCPLWFIFSNSTKECECGNDLGGVVHCDSQYKRLSIQSCNCMTQDESLGVAVGSCSTNCFVNKYNSSFEMYLKLPTDPQELSSAMCEDRWNRGGRFCGECKRGYYPLVYSYDMKCTKCENSKYNWLKFIIEAFLPLTIFFVFIISTGVSASSPALDAFVVYSQTIATPANMRMVLEGLKNHPEISVPIRIICSLYGIWNLDFFRTLLPPNCLKISVLQALALDYIIAFYPLVLILFTYVLVCLYNRQFFLLVWLWKPFSWIGKSYSSRINLQSSIINAFVTFLLLSYVKLLSVSFDLLNFTMAYHPDGKKVGIFLYYDASIGYFGQHHLPYGISAISIVIIFNIVPLLFSLLHPLRCFKGCIGKWPALRICLDSYQGYYKDGTEGTRDCRWFSSLYLFARIALFVVFGFMKNIYFYPFASILLFLVVALIILCQPFKPQFGKYNTIHALLFLNLAVWFVSVICIHVSEQKAYYLHTFSLFSSAFIAILPLVYITCVVLKWIYLQKPLWNFIIKHCSYCCPLNSMTRLHQDREPDSIDSIPYRMDHSNEEQLMQHNIADVAGQDYGTFH